jgi:hypothetical protein
LFAHELGHVFGLDHSAEPEATMAPDVAPGACEQRTLSDDDRAGYCASYPLAEPVEPGPEAVESGPESTEPGPEAVEPGPEGGGETGDRDDGCGGASRGGMGFFWASAALLILRRCDGRARRCSAR